jgi:hypothetical protein
MSTRHLPNIYNNLDHDKDYHNSKTKQYLLVTSFLSMDIETKMK